MAFGRARASNACNAECTPKAFFRSAAPRARPASPPPSISLILPGCHSYLKLLSYSLPSFVRSEKGKREVRKRALLRGGALADDVASFVPPQESRWRNPILTARLPLPSAFLLLRPFSLKELLSSASVSASHSRAISFSFGSWFCRNVELAALPPSLPPSSATRQLEETCRGDSVRHRPRKCGRRWRAGCPTSSL